MRIVVSVFAICLIVLSGEAALSADLKGAARIVDGDTLAIGSTKIRLEGIDAPETEQFCLNSAGLRWTCGIEARNELVAHVAGRNISCALSGTDAYGRSLGTCSLEGEDLNGWMVENGWALAYVQYSRRYVHQQENARTHQRGLWSGAFIAPWDWRHRDVNTVVLGAYAVPVNAQSVLLPRSLGESAPSRECNIKGNINRSGERIYHMPGQQYYSSVRMDAGKRWFCTPEEAEAAGWRRSRR